MTYVEAPVRAKQIVAAARTAMSRDGVGGASVRKVAVEAGVPLGTLQHVFPTKELLFRAVIEDVVGEIAHVNETSADVDSGLATAIRQGVTTYWAQLVTGQISSQLMQHELLTYAVRQPGTPDLARWQYERYLGVVVEWCRTAAENAGEECAVSFEQLARVIVAGVDGLILQYISDPDDARARDDLDVLIAMLIELAGVRQHPDGAGARS